MAIGDCVRVLLAFLFLTHVSCVQAAAAASKFKVAYRQYKVLAPPPASGYWKAPQEVRWSYPVLFGTRFPNQERINRWLKLTTLKELFPDYHDSPRDLNQISAMSDDDIVDLIRLTGIDVLASEITFEYAFGNNLVFTIHNEFVGGAHPSSADTQLIFNANIGRQVDVFYYFKHGSKAQDELEQLLYAANAEEEEEEEEGSDGAPAANDSTLYCQKRALLWHQMKIRGATEVFIPYESDVRYETSNGIDCAKDGESLKGDALKRLFRSPALLEPRA